jgi:hypothetical protein
VISLGLRCAIGITQERTAAPLMSTAHAPHCARPQPNFASMT